VEIKCSRNMLVRIFFIFSILITTSLYGNSRGYFGLGLGIDWGGEHLYGNDNKSSFDLVSNDTIFYPSFGFEVAYDFFLIGYHSSFDFDRQMMNYSVSLNNFYLCNNIIYQRNYQLLSDPNYSKGTGWSDEYDGKRYDAFSIQSTGEAGYLLTCDFLVFKAISYKMLYLNTDKQKPGFGIGLLTGFCYDYSTLKSKEILIPAGERPYYEKNGDYKGDSILTCGPQLTPIISYVYEDGLGLWYIAYGVSIMPFPIRNGAIYTENGENNAEFTSVPIINYRIMAGIQAGGGVINAVFKTNSYFKEYNFPKGDDDVVISESVGSLELHYGVLF